MRCSWLLVGLLALPVGACASSNSVPDEGDPAAGGSGGQSGSPGSEGGKAGVSGTSGHAGEDSGGGRAGSSGSSGGASGGPGGAGGAGTGGAGQSGAAGTGAGGSGATSGGGAGAGPGGAAGEAGASVFGGSGGESGQGGAGPGGAGAGGSSGTGGSTTMGSACDGAVAETVSPTQPLTVSGDTSQSKNIFGAYCDPAGASGKDYVYKVVPAADGTIDLTLLASGDTYDPVLSVTAGECTVFVTNQDGSCTNFGGPGSGESRTVAAKAGQPFWVYVDGVKGHDGAFSLTAAYQGAGGQGGGSGSSGQSGAAGTGSGGSGAATGGTGGAGTSGTGGAGGSAGQTNLGATCATPITVSVPVGSTEVNGTTAGTGSKGGAFLGSCNATYDGPDRVIEVTAQSAGQLTIKATPLSGDYDVALYAIKDTCTTFVSLSKINNGNGDCKELFSGGVAETLNPLTVTANEKVYVVVDSNSKHSPDGGPFKLTLTLK